VSDRTKVLQVAAVDTTIQFMLLPLIRRLQDDGFEVDAACSDGPYVAELRCGGVRVHVVPMARKFASLTHLRTLVRLVDVLRRERYDVVHVHTPVAAVLGRLASWCARVPYVIYTAHGFYFHDRMAVWKRRPIVWLERWLGQTCTDLLLVQSKEDRDTAISEGIGRTDRTVWIGNGVDVNRFVVEANPALRERLELRPGDRVVGFVGRLVEEKGIWDLVRALALLVPIHSSVKLLIVGDRLHSDRDRRTGKRFPDVLAAGGLTDRVVFAGFQEKTEEYYALMDVFVLPSHREGMPRTILEAMAAGKPIVATDIRGCREEVVDGETGLLVPVSDPEALARAIEHILFDRNLARSMGLAGRRRAERCFREEQVLDRQTAAIGYLLGLRVSERRGEGGRE